MISHNAPISGIASFGDRYVATAGYDNQVILWDSKTQSALGRGMHDHLANQCEFSPDGTLLATTSSDFTARIWEVPTMRLRAVLLGAKDDVEAIAFHPNGQKIATSSRDGNIRIYSCDGAMLGELVGHSADVISVSWVNGGSELLSSSDDGTVRRWDASSGFQIQLIDFDGVETDTIAVIDENLVVAGNDDGQLIVIDGARRTAYKAHAAGVKRVVYDRVTKNLISLSYDRSAKFWRFENGELRSFSDAVMPDVVWPRSCTFVNESEIAFVTFGSTYASYDYRRKNWNSEKVGNTRGVNNAVIRDGHVYAVGDAGQVSRDGSVINELGSLCNFVTTFGSRLVAGGQLGRVLDGETGHLYHQHRSPLNCAVAFGAGDDRRLVVGTYTGEVLVFDLAEDTPRYLATVSLHGNAIKGLAWSEGKLFSACADTAMAIHDTKNWTLLRYERNAHGKIANGCAALSGGRFVSVSRDLKLRIWGTEDVETVETPHQNSIKCCAVSTDGTLVATGDYTGYVAIYSVPSARYVFRTRLTASGISSLIAGFSSGDFIATSYDGTVYRVGEDASFTRLTMADAA